MEEKSLIDQLNRQCDLCEKFVFKTNEINKRLTTLVVVVTAVLAFTILGMTWIYFSTDYTYPDVTQTNEQSVDVGGSE